VQAVEIVIEKTKLEIVNQELPNEGGNCPLIEMRDIDLSS
jgi:hypothetical protein